MTSPESVWSFSDIVAGWTAISYAAVGVWRKPSNRNAERISILLSTGLSLGPLLMIVADPFAQQFGLNAHLLERVVIEARGILWWASAVAVLMLTREFC